MPIWQFFEYFTLWQSNYSAGVDGDDRRLEHMDRLHRAGDGVGDVVELQIEEHRQAEPREHVDAVRAVGAAVGRNPVSVLVPCHRVLGAGGALTGYAGGLDRKRALLALEGALPA